MAKEGQRVAGKETEKEQLGMQALSLLYNKTQGRKEFQKGILINSVKCCKQLESEH